MDGDFQAHYLSAEQAYGAGDFHTAQSIVVDLLGQLDDLAENNTEQETVLAWRAFVALLAGNIQLYGLNEPNQASGFYELVLKSNPQDTLKGLAEQGLERIQERQGDVPEVVDPAPASPPPASTLIQDPFLTQPTTIECTDGSNHQENPSQATATPWLDAPAATQSQAPVATAPIAFDEEVAEVIIETDDGSSPVIEVQVDPEPEDVIEADVMPEPEPEPEPKPTLVVNPSIRQRLEQGRLQVNLPAQQNRPSEISSDRGKKSSRWSWLRKLSGRS